MTAGDPGSELELGQNGSLSGEWRGRTRKTGLRELQLTGYRSEEVACGDVKSRVMRRS
jgi:hypothetical protein